MTVRLGLLALLDRAPSYGYQLRADFERRTGGTWPLNIGQVYSTLDRLERDGLVEKQDADADGHVVYAITTEGHAEVALWLSSPVTRTANSRDELAVKFALAVTLVDVDIPALVQLQRTATLATLQDLTRMKASAGIAHNAEDLAWSLVLEGMIFAVEAESRWLDHVEASLTRARARGVIATAPTPHPTTQKETVR